VWQEARRKRDAEERSKSGESEKKRLNGPLVYISLSSIYINQGEKYTNQGRKYVFQREIYIFPLLIYVFLRKK